MAKRKAKPKEAPIPNEGNVQPPGQNTTRQLTGDQIIKSMKDTIKLNFSDTQDTIIKLFDTILGQLARAAQQINTQANTITTQNNHIGTLENFFKQNAIPLDILIPKEGKVKTPNRQTRRKIQQLATKSKKTKK